MKNNADNTWDEFQQTVSLHLIRHRSILDVMTKFQDSCSRLNRAMAKAVTSCGCLKIKAGKQELPANANLSEMSEYVKTHLEGDLCPNCSEVLEQEMGKCLFFLAAICALTGLNLNRVIELENGRISALGVYSLT